MRPDDKRKETSRLNALKSTGPKTPEGKRRSAFNSVTHSAYVKELILPGEELSDFQLLMHTHLDVWKPTNPIEETFVNEMVTTLWRLRRQAPAESSLIRIQMQRMSPVISVEFESVSAHSLHALAVAALHEHGDALNQIARQDRRLLSQYQKLTQQLLTMRQLFPPTAPDSPDFKPQSDWNAQNDSVETKLTEDQLAPTQPAENQTVQTELVETKLVETKLTGSVHLPLSCVTRVNNPHSTLYAALPPIWQPSEPAPITESETPAKAYRAMGSTTA